VSGVEVGLSTPRHPVTLGAARFVDHDRSRIVLTDDHGRFLFQPQREARAIFAAHELGFAETRLDPARAESLSLTLGPWSRIEGHLWNGTTPAANRLIALVRSESDGLVYHANYFTALTDPTGRFAMEDVPAGDHWLARIIRGMASHAKRVGTEPGGTARIDLGGEGRMVIGSVRLTPSTVDENWLGVHPGSLRRARDESPFVLLFDADGRFQCEDVPPGNYTLEVHYHDPDPALEGGTLCRGRLWTEVKVPGVVESAGSGPVDLGEFSVPLRSASQSGEVDP
jgi:hypothetical protein